jgi:long-chain acyl-CoA synthetase
MLTHRNLLTNVDSSVAMADYSADDISLGVLPLFHTFGITCTMLLPLLVGAGAVYLPRFSPAAALALIDQHNITCLFAVPSVYRLLIQAAQSAPTPPRQSTLRFCVAGGEALSKPVADTFHSTFGVDLLQGYGMTETSPVISINPPHAPRHGSVGVPLPWAEVRIVDQHSRPLPAGHDGELHVRGQCVMKGYYQQEEATRDTLDPDGWLRTGDIARIDVDGYIYITGRAKEMIISAGENISPAEIESVLESHPAIAEAAVIPMSDATRGEVPRGIVVLIPGAVATEHQLIDYCRERLSRLKRPRSIEIRDQLPHSLTGKILKRKL